MRIAFLSHEYPSETGGGGIGTYLAQVGPMLVDAGHDVTVFAGGGSENKVTEGTENGVTVCRVPVQESQEFRKSVLEPFLNRHAIEAFDVIEGTDFDASALVIKQCRPDIPLVVKLHTPRFAIEQLHFSPPKWTQQLRMQLGAIRQGRLKPRHQTPGEDAEKLTLRIADELAAPSRFVGEEAQKWTELESQKISVFPYPYEPTAALLQHPADRVTNRVTFLGRLEQRKGVIDLAKAIPHVLDAFPQAKFRFIGRSVVHGDRGRQMSDHLQEMTAPYRNAVEFTGQIAASAVPRALGETDILVAPSHWESFGLVCCEGLAAGAAVVGSANGGMDEILNHGRCGRLVDPRHPQALAQCIIKLLQNPAERIALGKVGRSHVLKTFNRKVVIPAQLDCYRKAIARAAGTPSKESPHP